MSPHAYRDNTFQKETEIRNAMNKKDWITTSEKMARTNNAIFTHCMPIDRGFEVTDDVANSDRSVIYDVAENRLHVQKAILALTMSQGILE
jgi:ornithine carbamoyltransferase